MTKINQSDYSIPNPIFSKYWIWFDLIFILVINSLIILDFFFYQATWSILVITDHQKVKSQAWSMLQAVLISTTTTFTKGNLWLSGMVLTIGLLYNYGKMNPIWRQILDLTFLLWNIGRNSKMNSLSGNHYHLGNSWKYINLTMFTLILHSRQTVLC